MSLNRTRWTLALLAAIAPFLVAADAPAPGRRSDQEALKRLGPLVGDWRGTGQPQRGSARGAWTETGSWAWKLTPDSAALELDLAKDKFFQKLTIHPDRASGSIQLDAILADGSKRTFQGKPDGTKPLALASHPPATDAGPARITLSPLHETRFLLLVEARNEDNGGFRRLAEVGYTRQGVAFAAGESGPVCIVTGGRGTVQVSYQGKSYWVCCTGCKDLFNDDPASVLAEAARKAKP